MPAWPQIVLFVIALIFRTPVQIGIATTTFTCETRGTFRLAAHNVVPVLVDGRMEWHAHDGLAQIDPAYWGPVPDDLEGQLVQAHNIVEQVGWGPWDCVPPDWEED